MSNAKNYARKNIVGHIFLKDKIIKKGMWDDFVKEIKEWSE